MESAAHCDLEMLRMQKELDAQVRQKDTLLLGFDKTIRMLEEACAHARRKVSAVEGVGTQPSPLQNRSAQS